MNKVNIYTIQQQLREDAFVSVPRIQQTYGLTYRQAKRFLQNLLDRGWIVEKPTGIRYRVCKDMLKLRTVRKEETTELLMPRLRFCAPSNTAVRSLRNWKRRSEEKRTP